MLRAWCRGLAIAYLITLAAGLPRAVAQPPGEAPRPGSLPAREYGEDVVPSFEPAKPLTEADRARIESYADFAAARALESRRQWSDAIARLKKVLERDPESVAALRRLSRLCFVLGQTDEALGYAQRVLDAEPGDTETLSLLVSHYDRKNDPAGAEALLRRLLENPKLERNSSGYLLIQRDLGFLYADRLNQPAKAADAFRVVLDALDDKAANTLSLADQRRLLGFDEAATYGRFGEVFLESERFDEAITAFRRGLVYDPDNPVLPRLLAQTQLQSGKTAEALAALEPFLKRQPQGREPYELLIEILTRLERNGEVLPRLEAAARNDPRNLPLQYLLADQYREIGQPEKAEALYKNLLATQPDPQGFGALAATLVKEQKTRELIELFGRAFVRPETFEAVKPQIESVTNDPALADKLLDEALAMQQAEPPTLTREMRLILTYIANKAKKIEKLIPIQRLALEREPSPQGYREFWLDLYRNRLYGEAVAALEELLQKYPDEKDPQTLVALTQTQLLAGRSERALQTAEEALRVDPRNVECLRLKGFLLGKLARNDEAIALYQGMLEQFPGDAEVTRLARSGLSVIYVNMDQFDKGEAELEILLEMDKDDPGVNNDLGYLYADQGKKLDQAEAMIRKAVESDPENSAYLDSLGWVLYRQGRVEEAIEPLSKAVAAAKEGGLEDPTLLDHLGDAQFKLGRFEEAGASWKRAEELATATSPPDRRLPEIRKKLESLQTLAPAPAEPPQP